MTTHGGLGHPRWDDVKANLKLCCRKSYLVSELDRFAIKMYSRNWDAGLCFTITGPLTRPAKQYNVYWLLLCKVIVIVGLAAVQAGGTQHLHWYWLHITTSGDTIIMSESKEGGGFRSTETIYCKPCTEHCLYLGYACAGWTFVWKVVAGGRREGDISTNDVT